MLQLKHITKDYAAKGALTVHALRDVTLEFRRSEFVSVLGPSGCGKTTLLNIIGGLDRYTEGEMTVDGVDTARFGGADWDDYRNSKVGFVFQSYNLIPHINVLQNVALSLTFARGGVNRRERLARAKAALERVGLGDHLKKRPNQLSGGQMQRVAIARALVSDPQIVLADEPTGALDTETGVQVMDLLKEIARDRLVILVTHNVELAESYSTRIIRIIDGRVVDDTDPLTEAEYMATDTEATNPDNETIEPDTEPDNETIEPNTEPDNENIDPDTATEVEQEATEDAQTTTTRAKPRRKRRLARFFASIGTAFGISLRNLWAKKGRTLLTAFAGSIGIFGIALVLAISGGMGNYVDYMQTEAVGDSAVTIGETAYSVSRILSIMEDAGGVNETPYPDIDGVVPYQRQSFSTTTTLSDEFIDYIRKMDPAWVKTVNYSYSLNMHVLQQNGDLGYKYLKNWASNAYQMVDGDDLIEDNYNVLYKTDDSAGYPENMTEIALVVDKFNRINPTVLDAIGIKVEPDANGNYKKVLFEDIVGKEYTIVLNDG